MDMILSTIKKAVKHLYGDQIDYSKTYRLRTIMFNPGTQSITGQPYDSKLPPIIKEAPIFINGFKYTLIPPGTDCLLTFESSDPNKPVIIGIASAPGTTFSVVPITGAPAFVSVPFITASP